MFHIACRFLIAAALMCAACTWARAEVRVALVIGNGAYQNVPRLVNPANDAEDVAAALKRDGFDTILATDLDKDQMDEATIRFAKAARTADVAMFYYSGHALQFGGVNYLAPVDAKLTDEADLRRFVRVDEIVSDLQQAKNLRILVLDACRNDPLADELKRSVGPTRALSLQQGLAKIDAPQGMIVAYSTQAGTEANDGSGRNSPYTASFLKEIEKQDEIGVIFRRISKDVYEATDHRQLPELSLSLIGDFFLRGTPEAAIRSSTSEAPPSNVPRFETKITFNGNLSPPESKSYVAIDDNVLARSGPSEKNDGLFRISAGQKMQAVGEYVDDSDSHTDLDGYAHLRKTWVRFKLDDGREAFLQKIHLLAPNQYEVWQEQNEKIAKLASLFDQADNSSGPLAQYTGIYCPGTCIVPAMAGLIPPNLGLTLLLRNLIWFEGDQMHWVAAMNPKALTSFTVAPSVAVSFASAKKAPFKGLKDLPSYRLIDNHGGTIAIALNSEHLFLQKKDGENQGKWSFYSRRSLSTEQYNVLKVYETQMRDQLARSTPVPSSGN